MSFSFERTINTKSVVCHLRNNLEIHNLLSNNPFPKVLTRTYLITSAKSDFLPHIYALSRGSFDNKLLPTSIILIIIILYSDYLS